ncbi:hypothetical protein EJB05_28988 [Eragrostis curvula]|uniref:F-box domain-containing protein n=1 Tax=Eragrostis curvula TaxID=38414 RepID=A0A5J9UT47_9POAL|nr:hypothetical protein EJB05_28988 [Eragrostis curvula]
MPQKAARLEVDGDRFSVLPDAILQHVLSFLPAQDAVRTCILARLWRHLWKLTTGLRLWYDAKARTSVQKFQLFVDHLMLLRGRAPLETCHIRFYSYFNQVDKVRLNLWIRHAVMCQIQMLRLDFMRYFRMPTAFDTHRDSFDLDDLPFVSRHLTRLELCNVNLGNRFVNFSSCPSLEHLSIEQCYLCYAKEMSSGSLKSLSIRHCCFNNNTRIQFPSLVSLHMDARLYIIPVLERMPLLKEAFIRDTVLGDMYDEEGCFCCSFKANDNKFSLLDGLSEAKNLALISESDTFVFRCDSKQFPTFSKLKTLLLNDQWCVAPDFHALTCILKHSPVLENLTLQLFPKT